MNNFTFNYVKPRKWFKDGKIEWALPNGGEEMQVGTLDDAHSLIIKETEKGAAPWCQVFNNGFRVAKKNIDWSKWNGVTFSDVDSKHFYDEVKPFDTSKLLEGLFFQGETFFKDNFYAIYMTNSMKGYRILWYWGCDRTEENFRKCAALTDSYTKEIFYRCGDDARKIIDYKNVIDNCANSIYQGFYVTKHPIYYNSTTPNGSCNLDDIDLEKIYETKTLTPIIGDYKQKVELVDKTSPKANIEYYGHHARWNLYDALITVFKEKPIVDAEWEYLCTILPEGNEHTREFFRREPDKNKWYERYDSSVIHKVYILRKFGYKVKDECDYIYAKEFKASWQYNLYNIAIKEYLKDEIELINTSHKKIEANTLINKLIEDTKKEIPTIFDIKLDELPNIGQYRNEYYKSRFSVKDWKYLHNHYECPKDVATYSMFADLYYRDENNVPTVRYDILEDNIEQLSYWYESQKCQWHTLKYNNEWTDWCNHDVFSNKCNRTDLQHALYGFIPHNYGFNVIKDYWKELDSKKADVEKLETWGIRYFGMEDTPYVRWVCKTFFIAVVAKQMVENPADCVFPHVLCLQGKTGCGKSFFFNTMFTIKGKQLIVNDVNPNWEDKVIGPIVTRNLLIQFSESSGLKKADVNVQKEFVDRVNSGFKYQRKYENEQTTAYFRGVVCRSTNEDTLFNDISISSGDRRNLLLVCNTPEMNATKEWREKVAAEKDIIWATAYKLYMEDPNQDLQLPVNLFFELAKKQEDFKLTPNEEIKEIYEEIFNRNYYMNIKGELQSEENFKRQIVGGEYDNSFDIIGEFGNPMTILKVPTRWFKNAITYKYGVNTYKLLKEYMERQGWVAKTAGYGRSTMRCFVK